MFAQLSRLSSLRLAALAVAVTLGGRLRRSQAGQRRCRRMATPATSIGPINRNGWNRQWPSQRHHRNQFNNRSQVIIGGGSGIIIAGPDFVVGNPGVIVRQPGFIVAPSVRRPNFIGSGRNSPGSRSSSSSAIPRCTSGKPWWHKNWNNKHWKHNSTGSTTTGATTGCASPPRHALHDPGHAFYDAMTWTSDGAALPSSSAGSRSAASSEPRRTAQH